MSAPSHCTSAWKPAQEPAPRSQPAHSESLTVGAQQSQEVSHCACWRQAVTGASPLGSSHSKGASCGSCGKPPCWHRQSEMGVLLEAAMLALPCRARSGLPPPVLRPGRAGQLILSMTQRGYFFAFSAALLALHSISHVILWSKPVLNEQHGSPRMFSLLFCARAEICSLWEMLLQTLSWASPLKAPCFSIKCPGPKGLETHHVKARTC